MSEFKAKIASHSIAMAQIFNAEIVRLTCSLADHGLFSTSLERTHRLAMSYNLSTYDAAYLELAERKQAGLATLDTGLRKAAQTCGVSLFAIP